jgi:hypothetical protein
MIREDTQPWYRQFWPWFIIAIPASSVVAGLTTVWISMQTSDSLVIDSIDGVQIVAERRLNAEQLASELDLVALLDIDLDAGALQVAMRRDHFESAPTSLELELSHPTLAERDQLATLHRAPPDEAGNLLWSGHIVGVPDGRWYVTLKSGDDARRWRLSGEWQGESRLTLRPAESRNAEGY